MREIKSITVQGLGHWQIGDKIGDGVIWAFSEAMNDNGYVAHKRGWDVLALWQDMPVMVIFGEMDGDPIWRQPEIEK